MKQSQLFVPTLREIPSEAEVASHQWMLRAGMIRQLASGVYTYLPLAYKVIRKVEEIVREEMNREGAQELLMPAIQPAELWQESGRWDVYGPELVRFKDRHDRSFALGPTHEEVITTLVRDEIRSYKKLPLNLYQIQTKFRDERRPRFGILRGREFIMKDAYSFDIDREGLDASYEAMYRAYMNIFRRCGLNFRAVDAAAGAIGGKVTKEFMVLAEIGEDTIAYCTNCDYAANIELAEVVAPSVNNERVQDAVSSKEKIATPDARTIEQIARFFEMAPSHIIKTLIYRVDDSFVAVLVRGDHEVNEAKIAGVLGGDIVELADAGKVKELTGTSVGSVGPIGLGIEIIADASVMVMEKAVCGANEEGFHFINVDPGLDFQVKEVADLRNIEAGEPCPRCASEIQFARGIEVGHIFKLGTKYSDVLGAKYLDVDGREQLMVMGCYGIGVSRTVAAAVEQNHDEHGIVWPLALAPYHIHVIPVNTKDQIQANVANDVYQQLMNQGYDVLIDDRAERAGVKFKDSDILGIPLRIIVGGQASEGMVEMKVRKTGEVKAVKLQELLTEVEQALSELK